MKTTRSPFIAVVVFLFISMSACQPRSGNNSASGYGDNGPSSQFVSVDGTRFVDPDGRHLILHGINVVNKNPKVNYLGNETRETFKNFKSYGFNCVRLGIIWDGLEPEPGVYDDEYLKGIDQRIQWAREQGLYVYLDMHQDLFSIKFSDGAPEWATLVDGLPHEQGAIWSDSYLISPAVQRAFDNFWKNAAAPDGIGIQDHYVNAWQHVARRYADNPAVLGYDIMNEPFMGSAANGIMPALLTAYAMILVEKTGQAPPSEEELVMMWAQEESRLKVLETLSDAATYSRLVDAMYEINAGFEKGALMNFYQKARHAIRKVDTNHIIFIEHSYFSNTGTASAIEPLVDEQGVRDDLVAYAAHGYDLVTDTKALSSASNERVRFIFDRITETSKRLNMPVLLGEWGAYNGNAPGMVRTADFAVRQQDDLLFSDTFWAYYNGVEEAPFFQVLKKMYPMAVSGALQSYGLKEGRFTCSWKEQAKLKVPTVIYVPNMRDFSLEAIEIVPEAEQIVFDEIQGSEAGYLIIAPADTDSQRDLTIYMATEQGNHISLKK